MDEYEKQEAKVAAIVGWVGLLLIAGSTSVNAMWGSTDTHTMLASMVAALGGFLTTPFFLIKVWDRAERKG